MKKKLSGIIRFNIFLIIFLFVLSCGDEISTQSNTNTQPVLNPLHVGNSWTYTQTRFDSSGTKLSSFNFTSSVYRDTMLGNEKWYGRDDGTYACNRSNGYWFITSEWIDFLKLGLDSLRKHIWLQWAYPSSVGNRYNYISSKFTVTVKSTDIEVSVPAGKFICYEYEREFNGDLESKLYFAPNVGLVREDYYGVSPKSGKVYIAVRNELITYHLE